MDQRDLLVLYQINNPQQKFSLKFVGGNQRIIKQTIQKTVVQVKLHLISVAHTSYIISCTSTDVLPLNAGTSFNTPTKLSQVGCFFAGIFGCFGILMTMYSSVSVTSTSLWVSKVFMGCCIIVSTNNSINTYRVNHSCRDYRSSYRDTSCSIVLSY